MGGPAGAAGPVRAATPGGARSGGSDPASAFLRIAVVGPTNPDGEHLAAHTLRLAHQLAENGHDVTVVSWTPQRVPTPADENHLGSLPFPRTVRSLAWNRPDTWVRTGRRLRAYDTVVVVHTGAALVPQHLALLRAAGIGRPRTPAGPGPRGVLVCESVLGQRPGAAVRNLVGCVLRAVDGVLVHDHDEAGVAIHLGATRVYAVPQPDSRPATAQPFQLSDDTEAPDLSAAWAAYLGAVEALAAPQVPAADLFGGTDEEEPRLRGPVAVRAVSEAGRLVQQGALLAASLRRRVELTRADLPDWLLPTDVLDDGWQAEEARDEARRLGLPRVRDRIAAWAALGALAAVVRVADDGRHAAVVVDESGPASPLSRWARACGFAPVDLGLTSPETGYDVLEVDAASLDVVARVHPGGCDAADVDEAVSQAAWALRTGGLLVLTLPLGRPGAEDALAPADVRAAVARAHDHGFVLVGDLDGDVGRRMRAASLAAGETIARVPGAAYGLVRLTLRRR